MAWCWHWGAQPLPPWHISAFGCWLARCRVFGGGTRVGNQPVRPEPSPGARAQARHGRGIEDLLNWRDSHINKWGQTTGAWCSSACCWRWRAPVGCRHRLPSLRCWLQHRVLTPMDFVHVVLAPQGWVFEAWLALGALGGAGVCVQCRCHAAAAGAACDRAASRADKLATVLANPVALAPVGRAHHGVDGAGPGYGICRPGGGDSWLGHASWHAYRDLVDAPTPEQRRCLAILKSRLPALG